MKENSHLVAGQWGMNGGVRGLQVFTVDLPEGALQQQEAWNEERSFGALLYSDYYHLIYYAIEERNQGHQIGGGGLIGTAHLNKENNQLKKICEKSAFGSLPCYLTLSADNRYLLTACHGSRSYVTSPVKLPDGRFEMRTLHEEGSVTVYRLDDGGRPFEVTDIWDRSMRDKDSGPEIIHCIEKNPAGTVYLATGYRTDRLYTFALDEKEGKLNLLKEIKTEKGSNPRYCRFHSTLPIVYVNHEKKPIISSYDYRENGELTCRQTLCLPCMEESMAAPSDFVLNKDCNMMYAAVRGVDAIYAIRIDEKGNLKSVWTTDAPGGPRGLYLMEDEKLLYVANNDSKNISVHRIREDGSLEEAHWAADGNRPGCFCPV